MTIYGIGEIFKIQKSPIKSGIKTFEFLQSSCLFLIQKSPIKSGIKTPIRQPLRKRSLNSKKPHQIGD